MSVTKRVHLPLRFLSVLRALLDAQRHATLLQGPLCASSYVFLGIWAACFTICQCRWMLCDNYPYIDAPFNGIKLGEANILRRNTPFQVKVLTHRTRKELP
ncbi:hypothetical protein DFH07DRAFT_776611 [Mycena maculata]|uniref:Uncharacterized protein n=1 Tax=Mycena maculata TaxID=230809 RepID=A0AAD7N496_9AGAR|nr:hypothetical protein DFH07DRAFT_776611 [Mycena maculata]